MCGLLSSFGVFSFYWVSVFNKVYISLRFFRRGFWVSSFAALISVGCERAERPQVTQISTLEKMRVQLSAQLDNPLNQIQLLGAGKAWNWDENSFLNSVWQHQTMSLPELLSLGVRYLEFEVHDWNQDIYLCYESCERQKYGAKATKVANFRHELFKLVQLLQQDDEMYVLLRLTDRTEQPDLVSDILAATVGEFLLPSNSMSIAQQKTFIRQLTPRKMLHSGRRVFVLSDAMKDVSPTTWDSRIFEYSHSDASDKTYVKDIDVDVCHAHGRRLSMDHIYTVIEDKTKASFTGQVSVESLPGILACGVDIVRIDRWNTELFEAALWGWLPGEPNNWSHDGPEAADCAALDKSGQGWLDVSCGQMLAYACQSKHDMQEWRVTEVAGVFESGAQACQREFGHHYSFEAPGNLREQNILLSALFDKKDISRIHINLTDAEREGRWRKVFNDVAMAQLTAWPEREMLQPPSAGLAHSDEAYFE